MPRYSNKSNSIGIQCPICSTVFTDVIDSIKGDNNISRRRKCKNGHRFTTVEIVARIKNNKVVSSTTGQEMIAKKLEIPMYPDPPTKKINKSSRETSKSSTPSEIDYKKIAAALHNLKTK